MKRLLVLISVLFVFGERSASQSTVSATVDKQKILIGEPVQLYLKAVLPRGASAWFTVDTLSHFEVLQRSKIDSQVTEGGLFLQQTITLTSWDSGRWQIPSLVLQNRGTKPLVVDVGYSPMEPNQPYHDIKDILAVQTGKSSNWFWYLLGIAVLIALFMLFFPGEEKKAARPVVVEDPYRMAMRRLDAAETSGDQKVLFTELTAIFRDYLAYRKGIASQSATTDDLSRQLKDLDIPVSQFAELVQTLQLSDMVKFARYQPHPQEAGDAVRIIRKNIQTIEERTTDAVRVDTTN